MRKTPSATWQVEDVYAAILYKKSVCVIGEENGEIQGFFVGYLQEDKKFFVWAVWAIGGLTEGVKHLKEFCKQANCKGITFQTDRKGWDKVAKKFGFRPSIWTMEL